MSRTRARVLRGSAACPLQLQKIPWSFYVLLGARMLVLDDGLALRG
jgi:hypothetical protein